VTIGRTPLAIEAGHGYDNHNFLGIGSKIFFVRDLDSISENQRVGQVNLRTGARTTNLGHVRFAPESARLLRSSEMPSPVGTDRGSSTVAWRAVTPTHTTIAIRGFQQCLIQIKTDASRHTQLMAMRAGLHLKEPDAKSSNRD
jgi:hypothetical protein